MFVMTMDQRASSGGPDRVAALVEGLNAPSAQGILRPFQRTAGDEVQGVVELADTVVGIALSAARSGHWSVGIGVGAVRRPLPAETRAGAGPAFEYAREAVERAKHSSGRVAVSGPTPGAGHGESQDRNQAPNQDLNQTGELLEAIEASLQLLAELEFRRSAEGQEAGRWMDAGKTQREAADELGVSQQAVSSRLRSGLWGESRRLASVVSAMLERVDRLVEAAHEETDPGGQA
ncbi:hypothetical protein AB0K08_08850 [Citricoccus sp. NPDC055426]|uniref:hypothetical protein n=1 Tax=Citricoccus sp. NPDC055426 TaxID=3155536 RepID=UPI0034148CFB